MRQFGLKYFAILLLSCALLSITTSNAMALERLESREYPLKAAFIYNFIKFTRWPVAKSNSTASQPLLLAVAGLNPFGDALIPLTKKQVAGRSIVLIDNLANSDWLDANSCPSVQVLFVASKKPELFCPVITAVKGKAVLTISDAHGFAHHGGCIELRQHNGKIRFILNRSAIEKQGLELSYKVYSMALEVVEDIVEDNGC